MICEFEQGTSPILNRHIISICAIYNVNEHWFRTGIGDMFKIVNVQYDQFFSTYNKLSEPLQKFLLTTAKELLKAQNDLNI